MIKLTDPEHLNGSQRRVLQDDGSKENDEHSDDIDGELELKELSYIVINVSSVFQGNDDGGEVVIKQDDVASALGNISSSDSHGESDISLGEGRGIISSISSNSNHSITSLDSCYKQVLVLG